MALLYLTMTSLVGCSQTQDSVVSQAAIPVVQSSPAETAINSVPTQAVDYDICGEIAGWQRLEHSEQVAALRENPRYGDALSQEPLKSLFDKFWQESVITFTTYGLSARTEPVFLSGVWTGIDAMADCYTGDQTTAINQGEMAEMWLIGHQVSSIVWTGDEYQIDVVAGENGLQFVQFERLESNDSLPIIVIANTGQEMTFASGDW